MAEKPIFDKKNVLVTGGAGFLGSFLCERLLKEGNRVVCVDNFVTSSVNNIEPLLKLPDFEFIRADVTEPLDLESLPELERFKIRFQGIQQVYHLACPMSVKNFDQHRLATVRANSVGMLNVLELAVKYGARFFLASTSVVYGPRPADLHPFREDEFGCLDHLQPRACYDEGRRWAETMAFTYAQVRGLDVRIARIFRTYGPRLPLDDGHMIPDFIMNAMEGSDLVIYGDENFRTSLIFVSDVVDGVVRLMSQAQNPGPVNIGSDYDLKITDVAKRIIEMTGSTSKIVFEPPLAFMTQLGLPDLTRAKDGLGWIPLVSLEQGLKKSVEYTIANRNILRAGLSGK
jgi:UDP-glucuronate decarboxylase